MSALKRKILSAVGDHFASRVRVVEVNEVSPNFRFIDLEGDAFKTMTLGVGEKVQINTGGWELRTYTPLTHDRENGRLGILAYLHGNGPGSAWAARAKSGDDCQLIGPHRSLRAPSTKAFVFFGDETAIGAAGTLKRRSRAGTSIDFIFEAAEPGEVSTIVDHIGLDRSRVFPKTANGDHPEAAVRAILDAAGESRPILLAGRAESIRRMRIHLRAAGVSASRFVTKVYWADGKTGLD